jgi:phosphoglycolate phosphatase
VIARNQLRAPLFVGDAAGDQEAARGCGVPFVHAGYGFGSCPGAEFRLSEFAQLEILLGERIPLDMINALR